MQKLARSELIRIAREEYARQMPEPPKRTPERNVGATLVALGAERVGIEYGGVRYELRPVSFEDGLRLIGARSAIERLGEVAQPEAGDVEAYRQALRTVVKVAKRYIVPVGWRKWLPRRNPWRSATEVEVGQLLGFALGCRTRSRVRYLET